MTDPTQIKTTYQIVKRNDKLTEMPNSILWQEDNKLEWYPLSLHEGELRKERLRAFEILSKYNELKEKILELMAAYENGERYDFLLADEIKKLCE